MTRWLCLMVLCTACDCADSHELDAGETDATAEDARRDAPTEDARTDASRRDAPPIDVPADCPPSFVVRRCGDPLDVCAHDCVCGTRVVLEETCDVDEVGSCFRERSFCDALETRVWQSVEELECGLGPMGVETCNWTITFSAGRFEWSYSDAGESGPYTCGGDLITTDSVEGTWDRSTQTLTWDGVVYRPLGEACPD